MDPSSNSHDVQPAITDELFELKGILEEAWPLMRPTGLVCEVPPPAAGDGGGDGDGEGQGGEGLGLYDLSAAPEHLRPALEQELKKIEANATRKFQEHADFRKSVEPLIGIEGLTDVPADELTELVQFRQVLANPESFEQWWHQIGNELGFLGEGEPEGEGDDELGDGSGDEDPQVAALEEKIAQLEQRLEQRDQTDEQKAQAERQREAEQAIEQELKSLHEHADYPVNDDGEPDDELIAQLALPYADAEDAIQKGFEQYLRITGKAQSSLVEEKLDQPTAANRGGRADTTPEPVKSFDQAQELALARLGGSGR